MSKNSTAVSEFANASAESLAGTVGLIAVVVILFLAVGFLAMASQRLWAYEIVRKAVRQLKDFAAYASIGLLTAIAFVIVGSPFYALAQVGASTRLMLGRWFLYGLGAFVGLAGLGRLTDLVWAKLAAGWKEQQEAYEEGEE